MPVLTVIAFLIPAVCIGVNPSYKLTVRNMTKPFPNTLEFDLYMVHTNFDSANFEYAGGQYYFDFNSTVGNGGSFTYSIIQSDLPQDLQPRNPIVYLAGGVSQMRLSLNTIPNPGSGYIISPSLPGTKVVRMRLETNAKYFSNEFLQMRWRNGPNNPYTKVFAYVNSVLTEITNPQNHSIDSIQIPLPVEMQSLTALVKNNNVHLKWITNSEINNQGFQIERRTVVSEWVNAGFVNGSGNSNSMHEYSFTDTKLNSGIYDYRLKQIDFNGAFNLYYLKNQISISNPSEYFLSQNYPNPFNPSTKIDFAIPGDCYVEINLFDISGREVAKLFGGYKSSGYYTIVFDSHNLSSGIYLYKMTAKGVNVNFSSTKRLIIVK